MIEDVVARVGPQRHRGKKSNKIKFKLQERKSLKATYVFCSSASMDRVIFEKIIVTE